MAASSELERAERVVAALREAGCELTYDWTVDVRAARERGVCAEQLDDHEARRLAEADLRGVRDADVCLLLAPEAPTFGAGVEFGVALVLARDIGRDTRLYVSGPAARRSIFTRARGVSAIFATDEDAVAHIGRLR